MVYKTHEELAHPSEIENYAIGCLITDPSCREEALDLTADHFYSDRNRIILVAIDRLQGDGLPVDAGTIAENLANQGKLSDIGGFSYLLELMDSAPQIAHFSYYAKQVIDRSHRSLLKKKLLQAAESLSSGEDIEKVLEGIDLSYESISNDKFKFLNSSELIDGEFSNEYLLNGVLVKGQPCIIAGPKKCLKTNLLIAIGFSLATGNPFLGKFNVPNACSVGIMSGESGQATIQETFSRIVKSAEWSPQGVDGLHFCFELPALENQLDIAQIKRVIKNKKLDVLIIDPAYLCLSLGEGASNLFSVGEKLKPLSKLGQETGCTIILIHHTRKSNGLNEFSEPQLEEIAFAGFQEWARQWILLNRREVYQPDNPGVHKLWLVAGGSAGHSQSWALNINEGSIDDEGGRIWETKLFPTQEARAEKRSQKEQRKQEQKKAQAQDDIRRVVEELESLAKPATATKIRDGIPLPTGRAGAALASLVKFGQVICTEQMAGNGKLANYYAIGPGTAGRNGIEERFLASRPPEGRNGKGTPL
ncbi:MAG: AAA family ATPase [Planctomycetes bacterium]|nr:AAA family ATPase [Gammaproteobacteria bacterium]MCH9775898.1 AAA family ATPase [Planctomycetota bacterium]